MKVLLLDNYDSFTWNLVHVLSSVSNCRVDVFRNDEISLEKAGQYDKILLSPGPGLPDEAGIMIELIREFAASKSILGVCLGHQAIALAFGGSLFNLDKLYHGVATPIQIDSRKGENASFLFAGLPQMLDVGRYHSWMVNEKDLPPALHVTARDADGYIMAMQHQTFNVQGVQFHPESVLTPEGPAIIRNWLEQ